MIKNWYCKTYPQDCDIWEYMDNDKATFKQLLSYLKEGKDIYEIIPSDSIVRERCFNRLAKLTGLSYDEIYNLWIGV